MVIVGYYAHGNKHYVAFKDETDAKDRFMITDGFHERRVRENRQNRVQYQEDYRPYSRHKTMASASEIAAEGSRVNFFTIKARKCERWKI